MKYTPLFALATLALCAPAAHAQYLVLNSGDVVTVDGTGTHGTINNGIINNANTTYVGGTYDPAIRTNGTAVFTLGSGGFLYGGQDGLAVDAFGSGAVLISGGSITARSIGLVSDISGSTITVTGGTIFAINDLFASNGGSISLYGQFTDPDGTILTPGQVETLGGNASFTGTLENESMGQTFTYNAVGGSITLHDIGPPAAPEPSTFVALLVGALGLGALTLKARRRA